MADGANIGAGIGAFLAGVASGAAQQHVANTLETRKLQNKALLDSANQAIKSGDLGFLESNRGGIAGLVGKDIYDSWVVQAKNNTAEAKVLRSFSTAQGVSDLLSEMAQRQQGAQQEQAPSAPTTPTPETEAFRDLVAPSMIQEETITAQAQPQAQPTKPGATAPSPTPTPKPPLPPLRPPFELKGFTTSKEGDISFTGGLVGMEQKTLLRMGDLLSTMPATDAINQARSEGHAIDPKQEESFHQVDFLKAMNKFMLDNRQGLVNVDPRTKEILAFKHAENFVGSAFAPPDMKARLFGERRIEGDVETEIVAMRSETDRPLSASITAGEVAEAQRRIQTKKREQQKFEATEITRLRGVTEAGIPKPLGPVERKELSERLAVFDTLDAIRLTHSNDFVGFMAGRVRGVVTKVFGSSTKEATFRAELTGLKNLIIRLITGAQVGGPQEADRIQGEIPDVNDPVSTHAGKFNRLFRATISLQLRRAQIEESTGHIVPDLVWKKIDAEIKKYNRITGGKYEPDADIMQSPMPDGSRPPYLRSMTTGREIPRTEGPIRMTQPGGPTVSLKALTEEAITSALRDAKEDPHIALGLLEQRGFDMSKIRMRTEGEKFVFEFTPLKEK